jgi:hypothetical protein
MDYGPTPFDKLARFAAKDAPLGFTQVLAGARWDGWHFRRWLDTRLLPAPLTPERTSDVIALFTHPNWPQQIWAVIVEFKLEARGETAEQLQVYVSHLQAGPHSATDLGTTWFVGAVIVNLTGRQPPTPAVRLGHTGIRTLPAPPAVNRARRFAAAHLARIEAGTLERGALYWIPLMHGAQRPALIERWKQLVQSEPDATRQNYLVIAGLVFGEASGHGLEWETALQGWRMVESQALNKLIEEHRPMLEQYAKQKSELVGQIRQAQQFLRLPISDRNELEKLRSNELQALHTELTQRMFAERPA